MDVLIVLGAYTLGEEGYVKSPSEVMGRKEIIEKYFNFGNTSDYNTSGIKDGKAYLYRDNFSIDEKAKEYLKALFLRYVHPFNYFWVPWNNTTDSWVKESEGKRKIDKNSIGEYTPLIRFSQKKMREYYGGIYDEFLKMVMADDISYDDMVDYGSVVINLRYGTKYKKE